MAIKRQSAVETANIKVSFLQLINQIITFRVN